MNWESEINIFDKLEESYKEEIKKMGHANLIIAGKTGVGKSTLINSAFRENLATTGIGKPVTAEMKLYEKENLPLRLYDTVGLELDAETQARTISDITALCQQKLRSGNQDEIIHGMWYCVQSNSNRLESAEINFIEEIAKEIPIVLVLTQVITKRQGEAFRAELEKMNLNVKNIILVLAQDYEDDDIIKPAFGVDFLVEYTLTILPEYAQNAWINAQKASIRLKVEQAKKIVQIATGANFTTGFMPIPFADAPVLITAQIAMIAKITAIFGMSISRSIMQGFLTSLIGTTGATIAGRTITSNLLKLIPGAGTLVGGAVSGGTAAVLTYALGETYIKIMEMMATGELKSQDLSSKKTQNMIKEIFNGILKKHPSLPDQQNTQNMDS
ncbi:DUF697 domain-containing protein [Clostridiales bacterium COT073_COT-073]|nr:DUF697 domain-containing protein [Clostridiales bacterium COT073_COT-073]